MNNDEKAKIIIERNGTCLFYIGKDENENDYITHIITLSEEINEKLRRGEPLYSIPIPDDIAEKIDRRGIV